MSSRRISRRRFVKTTAGGVAGAAILREGVAGPLFQIPPSGSALLVPDSENGFFSIVLDDVLLISRAVVSVQTEQETVLSAGTRFSVVQKDAGAESVLEFADRRGSYDLRLVARRVEKGIGLRMEALNRTSRPARIRALFPCTATVALGGGLHLEGERNDVRVLTDEWERCTGLGGVKLFGQQMEMVSAWDVHLFEPSRARTLSISYLEIPRAKLTISLKQQARPSMLDVVIRADVQSGSRGVIVEPGKTLSSGELILLPARGTPFAALEAYADLIARYNRIAPPPAVPMGWVDWYFSFGTTTEEDILKNLDFIAEELKDFGLEYVQIDSGWQLGVETLPGPHNVVAGGPWVENSKFARGMKWYADEIKRRGLKPGIWVRPLQMIEGSDERQRHPEWFNAQGQMDCSHPQVREVVRGLFRKLVEEWGYEFIKHDFTAFDLFGDFGGKAFNDIVAHPEPFDQSKTTIESYRELLTVPKDAGQGKAWILGCNSLMPSTLGLASSFRIGDDVGDLQRTLTYGVKSVGARYYTNGIYWVNDPDCLLVRSPFAINEARAWASLIALSGGNLFVSEKFEELSSDQIDVIKKVLPVYRRKGDRYGFGRPLDLLENNPPTLWNLEVREPFGSWNVIGIFNWTDESAERTIDFRQLGLDPRASYLLHEFWEKQFVGERKGGFDIRVGPWWCAVIAVHPMRPHPFVLSTTRHVTQGAVELRDVAWDQTRRVLSGIARVVKKNPYDLVLWLPDRFEIRDVEGADGFTMKGDAIARVTLDSDTTRDVPWAVQFE